LEAKKNPLPWREGIEGRGENFLVHPLLYPPPSKGEEVFLSKVLAGKFKDKGGDL